MTQSAVKAASRGGPSTPLPHCSPPLLLSADSVYAEREKCHRPLATPSFCLLSPPVLFQHLPQIRGWKRTETVRLVFPDLMMARNSLPLPLQYQLSIGNEAISLQTFLFCFFFNGSIYIWLWYHLISCLFLWELQTKTSVSRQFTVWCLPPHGHASAEDQTCCEMSTVELSLNGN